MNVGQVEFELACGAVLARRHRLIPVTARVAEAPDVRRLVERYAALTEQELDRPAFVAAAPLEARDGVVRRTEVPLGRFVAEVMRERLDAEVGLLNSGGLRANRIYPSGPVTRRDIRTLLPFANTGVLLEIPGSAIRAALEHSVSALPQPAGRFLQTAGLRYAVDAGRPPGARVGGGGGPGAAAGSGARLSRRRARLPVPGRGRVCDAGGGPGRGERRGRSGPHRVGPRGGGTGPAPLTALSRIL